MSSNFSIMRFCGDHMIFQSGRKNTIFGHAPTSEKVTLKIIGITEAVLSSVSDENGRWEIEIPEYPSSFNAFALEFSCKDEVITFDDVLFGELYHISGQSNMELQISRTIDPLNEELPKENVFIREFRVPVKCCFSRDEEYDDFLGGEWKTAVREDIMEMSAAGYYFAAELYRKYNVPVGLVNTSAGGAPVEARMPYNMLSNLGGYEEFLSRCTAPGYEENTAEADRLKYSQWSNKLDSEDKISDIIFELDSGFTKCSVPFYFRDEPALKGFCGRIWFKKTFEIPENAPLDNAVLILGAMIDSDTVYINGKEAGTTGYMYPPRIYPLPKDILHSGENTVHICLEVRQGQGGFVKGKKYCLKLSDRIIDLSGEWEYIIAAKNSYLPPDVFFQGLPLSMYGALTAPAFNINFRGLIWYQGESNDRDPQRYYKLFKAFAEMYRARCGDEIPIIFTQLCNFDDPTMSVPPFSWAEIREQQLKCLDIPQTAMAVTLDIGEANDLHPINKRDVGRRLALCAERLIYNDSSAPNDIYCLTARQIVSEESNSRILLNFSDNASLCIKNDPAKHFELLTADGEIIIPKAQKTNIGIILEYDDKRSPVTVRYGWSNNPENPDLFDKNGLPLSPFRINIMRQVMIKELFFDSKIYIKIYQPDSRENGCAVVLSHGYNCSHDDLEDIARALAERGYFACTFDFCGGSTRSKSIGKSTAMSIITEIDDLNKVIEFTKKTSGADKIFLYGESQGGFVSALTACENKAVDGMALLYPAFCIPNDWRNKPVDEMKRPFEFMGLTLSKSFYDGLPNYDVFERIKECNIPVLLIQGTADRIVNEGYAQKAAEAFPNAVLKLYDGEGHGFSPKARQSEISDVTEFFDKYKGG